MCIDFTVLTVLLCSRVFLFHLMLEHGELITNDKRSNILWMLTLKVLLTTTDALRHL